MLMAILLPCLTRAREHAKRTVCMANLRSIGQGLYAYANDNQDQLVPGDCCISWAVWGRRTEGINCSDARCKQVNLGYLLTSKILPIPSSDKDVFFCPSCVGLYDVRPFKKFNNTWGEAGGLAVITYMFNDALDGFTNYVQGGDRAVLSHKDKINFLRGDGSVQVFNVKPLIFDEKIGPELLSDVSARYGVCFPPVLLHKWLEKGEVDIEEAKEYLKDPSIWINYNCTGQVPKPVSLASVGNKSLVCDVVGYPDSTEYG
jgi:hypothetical protein